MINTSSLPLTVDGVRLDTLAKNIETLDGRFIVPGRRTPNVTVPADDGELYVPQKVAETGVIGLSMWIRGCDDDGLVPTTDASEFFKNLDAMVNLFSRDTGLLTLQQTRPDGSVREAFAEVVSMFDFSVLGRPGERLGKFAVELRIPAVFWQDGAASVNATAAGAALPQNLILATLAGATAPMKELVLTITGPITNPRVTENATGIWVQYNGVLANGATLVISCADWTATIAGASVLGSITHGGHNRFLVAFPTVGGPSLTLSGAAGGAATRLSVSGRRKFKTA